MMRPGVRTLSVAMSFDSSETRSSSVKTKGWKRATWTRSLKMAHSKSGSSSSSPRRVWNLARTWTRRWIDRGLSKSSTWHVAISASCSVRMLLARPSTCAYRASRHPMSTRWVAQSMPEPLSYSPRRNRLKARKRASSMSWKKASFMSSSESTSCPAGGTWPSLHVVTSYPSFLS